MLRRSSRVAVWRIHAGIIRFYQSQRESFELSGFPHLVLAKKFEVFVPWWLEHRGFCGYTIVITSTYRYNEVSGPLSRDFKPTSLITQKVSG